MKTVVITAMLGSYDQEVPHTEDAEIWGVNFAYKVHQKLDRLYCMDFLDVAKGKNGFADYAQEVAALGIPFISCQRYQEIPNSRRYPIEDIVEHFGIPYFTSTICYMIAAAIFEGFDHIILHRMHNCPASHEYFHQQACLHFWCGMAMSRKIKMSVSEDSYILKPHPWEPELYGYMRAPNAINIEHQLGCVIHVTQQLPVIFEYKSKDAKEIREATQRLNKVNVYPVANDLVWDRTAGCQIVEMIPYPKPMYKEYEKADNKT